VNRQQEALLDVIRAFKGAGQSDIEAAINVIANHAATIKRLHVALEECRDRASAAAQVAEQAIARETEDAVGLRTRLADRRRVAGRWKPWPPPQEQADTDVEVIREDDLAKPGPAAAQIAYPDGVPTRWFYRAGGEVGADGALLWRFAK
jgi:hypothetical protein